MLTQNYFSRVKKTQQQLNNSLICRRKMEMSKDLLLELLQKLTKNRHRASSCRLMSCQLQLDLSHVNLYVNYLTLEVGLK